MTSNRRRSLNSRGSSRERPDSTDAQKEKTKFLGKVVVEDFNAIMECEPHKQETEDADIWGWIWVVMKGHGKRFDEWESLCPKKRNWIPVLSRLLST